MEKEKTVMTNEEIWEMLKPKMTKNHFNPIVAFPCTSFFYLDKTVHDMVALAYTCGYRRGERGKSFNYHRKQEN